MLLNVENISVIDSNIHAVELVILSVRYRQRCETVFWVGLKRLPTDVELDKIIGACMLAFEKTNERLILHFEHIDEHALEIPSFDMIKKIVGVLMAKRERLREKLLGSIFEARFLDEKTKVMRDLFLSLYKPVSPLMITDDKAEIEHFAEQLCDSSLRGDVLTTR